MLGQHTDHHSREQRLLFHSSSGKKLSDSLHGSQRPRAHICVGGNNNPIPTTFFQVSFLTAGICFYRISSIFQFYEHWCRAGKNFFPQGLFSSQVMATSVSLIVVRSGYGAAYATDNWKRRHSGPGVNGKLTLYSSFTS